MTLAGLLLWFVCFGAVGMLIGGKKGRVLAGLIWGMVLGPIGWLVVLLGPTIERKPPPPRPKYLR